MMATTPTATTSAAVPTSSTATAVPCTLSSSPPTPSPSPPSSGTNNSPPHGSKPAKASSDGGMEVFSEPSSDPEPGLAELSGTLSEGESDTAGGAAVARTKASPAPARASSGLISASSFTSATTSSSASSSLQQVPTLWGGQLLKFMPGCQGDNINNSWSIVTGQEFQVRGLNYLVDRKKYTSHPSALDVCAIDLVRCMKKIDNITMHPENPIKKFHDVDGAPFLFTVNFQVAYNDHYLHLCIYATFPKDPSKRMSDKTWKLIQYFMADTTSDTVRNNTFKLIPSIVSGPWLAKKAVGNKPALVGNKLATKYFKGPNHFEVSMDVGSSTAGKYILSVMRSYVRNIVVDLAFLLEGKSTDHLPEHLLGGIRIFHSDLDIILAQAPVVKHPADLK